MRLRTKERGSGFYKFGPLFNEKAAPKNRNLSDNDRRNFLWCNCGVSAAGLINKGLYV